MVNATAAYDLMAAMEVAVHAAIVTADPNGNVLVDWGYPEPNAADDMVLIMDGGSSSAYATMGTNRTREDTVHFTVHYLSIRSDQKSAVAASFGWAKLVERYVRFLFNADNSGSPFTGLCREIESTDYTWQGFTRMGDAAYGRGCELIATYTANVRVSA